MTKTMPCGCRWDGWMLHRCARHREPGSLAADIDRRRAVETKADLLRLADELDCSRIGRVRNQAVSVGRAVDILRELAAEQEPSKTKTIVIDPGHRHTPQCPFWTGAGAERHCRICPPDIELGQCFGAIPVWCPLPVLVRLKTDDEDMTAQLGAKEPEQPKEDRAKELRDKAELLELADAVESCYCERDERPDCPRKYLTQAARVIRKIAETRPDNISEHINGRSVTVQAEARESGELFGWVGPRKIAEAIRNELGVDVQPNQVILNKSFREFGVFDVSLRLECNPKIKVWIVKDAPDEPDDPEPDEPEEPKVKSLREASERLWPEKTTSVSDHTADLCAIVLRRVDTLEELIQHEFALSGRTTGALRRERAEIKQMLEGSE